ncbi:hypothetical protein QWY75_06655 [Pontixanthobacter aestiaquae]|uniref:Outer membrane receptor proteins, mostly Fe transport n=1 Tax=Pontixanthobacter aestiaquae TaxID=1509367 RepID=A0A844Z6J2_9SPHN|nr:hypothetical protein [Pontixanthobacter aestiaquae]MDN3645882.1 hypothetical protein [Pontixanthobacter aestiaquae]MXO83124.1 hypothetical protein [Pontixanthobacter aestiaquae]
MRLPILLCSTAAVAFALPTNGAAQEVEAQPASAEQSSVNQSGEIVVVGQRLRGQVETDQPPVLELEEEDIAAFGANSITDLLAAIEPQTSSTRGRGGGRPVFLINGVRVGSFREFRSYPTEAIRKVEVLPEETAQKFGFPPDRRVVNFILKDNFTAITGELEYEQPSIGGYSRTEQEATLLKITKAGRINLNVELNDVSPLTESDRDIIQTAASEPDVATDPDPAEFRTLIADSRQIEATANFAKASLENGSSLGLNATFNRSDSLSLSGVNTVTLVDGAGNSAIRTFDPDNPLETRRQTNVFSSSASYNNRLGPFQLTATADGSITDAQTQIDRRADVTALIDDAAADNIAINSIIPAQADAGFDQANSASYSGTSKVTLRGSPLLLPAGELSTTLDLGYDWTRINSEDSRAGSTVSLTRGDLSGGFTVGIPITSVRDEVWDTVGTISVNGQASFNHYSDFGTLYRLSGGVTWFPIDSLNLQATYVWREVPPSLSQLGSPQITTLNVPTFDFATGDTALVSVTSGGNPLLEAETQSDWSFSGSWEFADNARFRIDYSRNTSSDVSSSFPFLTPEIEAAFPGRVTRDVGGTLVALDRRPVDYFETHTERLTFGLNLRGSFGQRQSQPPAQPGGAGPERSNSSQDSRQSPSAGETARSGQSGGDNGEPKRQGRREAFMKLRERVCADDGADFLSRLVAAANRGERLEDFPEFDPAQAERILSQLRSEDGSIDPERLKQFRARICISNGPSVARAAGGDRGGRPDFANMSEETRGAFMQFRQRSCADDGEAFLTRMVEAIKDGDLPEELAGFDLQQAQNMLERLRDDDGTINTGRLSRFRSRMCSGPGRSAQAAGQGGGPPAGARGGGRGGGRFGRSGDGRGRYFFNLNHSVELNREVLIAPGGPLLDLLDGDSLSSSGTPRHNTRIEAGAFRNGWGTRFSVRYTGTARIDGAGAPNSTALFVDDLATFDLRLFADLGRVLKKDKGVFKGMRLSVRFDNIFDGRRVVRDSNGDIPLSFQPLLVDPTGRYLGVDIRKLF